MAENIITLNNKKIINIADNENEYTEKVTCKKCKETTFRPLEWYKLLTTEDDKTIYAAVIKNYVCPNCKSENFTSTILKGKINEQVKESIV